jgi:hypothetical protein
MKKIDPFIKIVCEGGKTEPNYFNGLLRYSGLKLANPAYKPRDHSPLGIVREAIMQYKNARKLKIPANQIHIWAVFDRDGHAGIPEAFDQLSHFPIGIAFSNICFEFWILLHYQRTSRQFQNCDEVIKFIRDNHDEDYGKANDHFNRLKDRIPAAIESAKWLTDTHWAFDDRQIWERNPYTDVYKIIQGIEDIIRHNDPEI